MNPQLIVALDVDGVVADLHTEWLRRYNRDHGDSLTVEDLRSWKISDAVKPEARKAIYTYLSDPDLYDAIRPMRHATNAVDALRRELDVRVIFVTSCVEGMADQKIRWLQRWGFIDKAAPGAGHPDVVVCHDKSLIRCDLMLDDYEKNLEGRAGGVLFDAPYNRHVEGLDRVSSFWEFLQLVRMRLEPKVVGTFAGLPVVADPSVEPGKIVMMGGHGSPTGGKKKESETILQEADRLVSGDRQASYGHPLDNWTLTAELMTPIAFKAITERGSLSFQDALLLMQMVKIARQMNAPKRDNLVDIGGYAKCLDMSIEETARRATT